ncbi:hypothetical protein CWS43_24430 [Rahnella sp. AA]|uniref:hypothetical protein n=1 Tax=Rahnella sp. AA TaxID=2057180 RepID=UPI000C33B1FB|nr:hypothetical protein [Rahnella sp. AA]PKE27828.1 hypothetical protein CWS43_24430 [Rahnella sp. AA]
MFTYFPTVCPANNANGPANQTQPPISLPGCVQTGQTFCCGSDQAQGQTYFPSIGHCAAQAQSPVSLPGCVQTGQTFCCGSDQAQGQTYFPSIGHCAAQAQFPTLSMQCVGITTKILTQVAGCSGQAQAQTYFPSIGSCAAAQAPTITIPQDCGVSWNCKPPHAQAQAQTYFPSIGSCAAAQTPTITIPQDCGVSWNCNQGTAPAQAQFPTLSMQCLQVTTKILTQVAGCSGQQAQAQTYFPSIGSCAAAQTPTITIPQDCGVSWNCKPPHAQAPAQAQTYFPSIGSCAAAQTLPITIPQDCGVSWNCNQGTAPAQAQFPTLSMQCLGFTTQILTQVAGCSGQAQAQTYFPSIGSCAAAQTPPVTIPQDCGVSWNCKPPAQAQTYFPSLGSC